MRLAGWLAGWRTRVMYSILPSTVARTQAGTFFFSYCTLCKCFFPSGRRVGERLYWNRHFRDELLWRDSWRGGEGRICKAIPGVWEGFWWLMCDDHWEGWGGNRQSRYSMAVGWHSRSIFPDNPRSWLSIPLRRYICTNKDRDTFNMCMVGYLESIALSVRCFIGGLESGGC